MLETMPQGGQADGNLQLLKTALLEFAQRQIGLADNPSAQSPVMLFQAGAPITADFLGLALARTAVLVPKTFHALAADAETLADLTGAFPTFPCRDNPPS